MFTDEEQWMMDRLAAIHQRIQEMADAEARSALVKGWAAAGGHLAEKKELIEKADAILSKLMGKSDA